MSWYTNPRLFIGCYDRNSYCCHKNSKTDCIYRIRNNYNVPLGGGDVCFVEKLDFAKHLSLGDNKESDYEDLKSWLDEDNGTRITKLVNCQGLVVYWNYLDWVGSWSRVEENDSVFFSLPGIINPSCTKLAEKQSDEKPKSELEAEISSFKDKLNNLQEQLIQEKNDRQALQAQVYDLTAKLQESSRGAGGGIERA